MTNNQSYTPLTSFEKFLPLDLSDVFTWSFPEFIPFCLQLYYFSSLKAFGKLHQA